jgi:hypothetical protein
MSKQSGNIICELTPWAKQESGGKGRKSDKMSRHILVLADKRNWALAIEREGYPFVGQTFGSRLGEVLQGSSLTTGLPFAEIIEKVAGALSERLEIPFICDKTAPLDRMNELDRVFETDLLRAKLNPRIAEMIGAGVGED